MGKKAYDKKSKRGKKNRHLQSVDEDNTANILAMSNGPTKKNWSVHDMKAIRPMTDTQSDFFLSYLQGDNICGYGSAGTGKTYVATALAIRDVIDKSTPQDKLIFIRSNVATRDVGHLPGTIEEKMEVYETPYRDILTDLFKRATTYDDMKERGYVQFMPTSFIRGLTWDNAIVIVDEVQNMTMHEINSIMTRLGTNTRVILVGDCVQTDLRKTKFDTSGLENALKVFECMKSFSVINFTERDIVRGGTVREWITNYERTLGA